MELLLGLEGEVTRYVVAEIRVDEVADKWLQSWDTFVLALEDNLLCGLGSDVIARSDPFVDCCNHDLWRDLHWEQHLDQLFTGFVLVEPTLGDVSADFPNLQEAKDDLLRVLLRDRFKERDDTALNRVEIFLHVCFQRECLFDFCSLAWNFTRVQSCSAQVSRLDYSRLALCFCCSVLLELLAFIAEPVAMLVTIVTEVVRYFFSISFMVGEYSKSRKVRLTNLKHIQIIPAV